MAPECLSRIAPPRFATIAVAIVLALTTGGCSFSYKLGGLFGKEDEKIEQTSAAKPVNAVQNALPGGLPSAQDLAIAKAAMHDVLSRPDRDTSLPWENPRTGARGTVTPIAAAYTQDGFVCRDFLASYVRDGTESWLQGEACRVHKGKWELKALRRLNRT
jgi:surface antigen